MCHHRLVARSGGSGKTVRPLLTVLTVVALAAIVGLGVWWWRLRTVNDPIDADPVSGYAKIVTSQPCTVPGASATVQFSTAGRSVTAPLHVCGYQPNQSILVEYLGSDPQQVRPAGTQPVTSSSLKRWLPIGILFFGVVGAGALLSMIRDRRRTDLPPKAPAEEPEPTSGPVIADGGAAAADEDGSASGAARVG